MGINQLTLNDIYLFSQKAHFNFCRADHYTPYFEHIKEVVDLLKKWNRTEFNVLATAYLHDVLEKTNVKEEELYNVFGDVLTNYVKEITFDENNESEENYFLRNQYNVVKLADHLTNTIYFAYNGLREPLKYYNKGLILVNNFRKINPYKKTIEFVEIILKNYR